MVNPVKKVLKGDFNKRKGLMFLITALVTLIVWNLPTDCFGIEGLTIIQQRVIAIFVMAVMLWLTEPIPAWATSVLIIFVLLFCVSDSAFNFLQGSEGEYGKLLDYQGVMASFADPTIILFLGGFILAIAATKSGLDVLMAKTLIAPFGKKSENVLLGFLLITGIFSMFVSNTATAAMMLTFLTPVFKALPANGKERVALTMAIPIGANLGGMGTPIGTPPNAFAFKTLNDLGMGVDFGQWMIVMAPMVIVMLLIAWFILCKFFPFSQKTIELTIEGDTQWNWRTWVVIITFALTIILWVFGKQVGINANTVAMLPIAIFAITGVITGEDLKDIDWGVIWMVAGGFALGLAMNGTGLAENAVKSIPFTSWNPIVILAISGLICFGLSNFISNTATAALLIPILTVVCQGMGNALAPIGGTPTVLIGIAVAASCAMSLPISTPPNAIAYSTGLIKQSDMAKAGFTVGVISLILGYVVLITFCRLGVL
jgi:sodium-dependent dicarboxylate transporter 2/3/5